MSYFLNVKLFNNYEWLIVLRNHKYKRLFKILNYYFTEKKYLMQANVMKFKNLFTVAAVYYDHLSQV